MSRPRVSRTVAVDLMTVQQDGTIVTKPAVEIPFTQLVSKLRGYAIGFEEVGEAAPMIHRDKYDTRVAKAFCNLVMGLADHSGPVLMDGYDVTGLKGINPGIESRFRQVTLPAPDKQDLDRAITDLCYEEAANRGLTSIEIKPRGREWLANKITKSSAEGHYRTMGEIVNRALDEAVAQLPMGVTSVELDKEHLIGTPVDVEAIAGFRRELASEDPPLFGLESQIRHSEKILEVLAKKRMEGEDPRAKIIFETPSGTGLDFRPGSTRLDGPGAKRAGPA